MDFEFANFENYNNMYHTGTCSYHVARSLLPSDAIILPIRSNYAVKYTDTASLREMQVRPCSNGARIIEEVHFDNYDTPVAVIGSIRVFLALGASQGKHVFILDIKNGFQNTIKFDPTNRTYNAMPPLFVEYLRIRWNRHPDLPGIEEAPWLYVVKHFCSMQGHKCAGQKFYQLMYKYLHHSGLIHSIYDHGVPMAGN
jgi:hypothetical protein